MPVVRQHRAVLRPARRCAASSRPSPRTSPRRSSRRCRPAASRSTCRKSIGPMVRIGGAAAALGRRGRRADAQGRPGADHPDHQARAAYESRMAETIARARRAVPARPSRARLDAEAGSAGQPRNGRERRRRQRSEPLTSQPVGDQLADLRPCVLLQEVARVGDHVVDLAARARRRTARRSRAAAPGLSPPTATASAACRRAAPRARAARPPRRACPGEVGRISGNARAPALDCGVRERRLVGGDHLVARVVLAGAADQQPDRQVLGALDEVAERIQASFMCWWPVNRPVSSATMPGDAIGMLDRQPQPDRAAPVVHDDRGVAQVELLEQRQHRPVWRS